MGTSSGKPRFPLRLQPRAAGLFLAVAACLVLLGTFKPTPVLTYEDLVAKLTDLEALATLPAPGEACAQWSSYDRAKRYDAHTGRYVNWDADRDDRGFIRKEGDSYVLAEMKGPGCIYRIWSAAPGQGRVKIFLDGAAEPAVDLPFSGYFDRQNPPFTYRSLVHVTHPIAGGYNCYVPIPYRKSCKITAEKGWGSYYHFTYATFPPPTEVPTFSRVLSPRSLSALLEASRLLANRLGSDPAGQRAGELTQDHVITVGPGATATAARLVGEGAITGIKVKLLGPNRGSPSVLRELVLKIHWDGEPNPSVWSPLGDYFGSSGGIDRYRSLPLGITEDWLYSFWYMPFASGAQIEVANGSSRAVTLRFRVTRAPLSRPIGELGRFHAKWHRDAMLPTEPGRGMDWTILKVRGRGRFCGVMLSVWNPKGGWWGEGDERFFVDGEHFPSTFGTGTEDYFGYAWSNPLRFEHAFHNQTSQHAGNGGLISLNRWQIADNVPFQTSFEGAIEKYFPNTRPTLYSCVVYWYQAPGGTDPYGPVPIAQGRLGGHP
jgi:hypothetical protein